MTQTHRNANPGVSGQSTPASAGFGLSLVGLIVAIVMGFVAGAGAGFLAPHASDDEETQNQDGKSSSAKSKVSGPYFFLNLAGAMVNRQVILLLGRDESFIKGKRNEEAPARSDTLMAVSVDPSGRRLTILSIPRDTRSLIRGHGTDKINAAYAYGGPKLAVESVSKLLGVPVDHYVVVKIDGLIRMVDLIGGVELEVPHQMRYTDKTAGLKIRLKKGLQTLDGQKAHEFIRFRHDNQGDIGRIARQQMFVKAVSQKLLHPQTVMVIPLLAQAALESIDTDIDPAQIAAIAAWVKSLSPDRIRTAMLPGEFSAGLKASYWLVDPSRSKRLASRLLLGEVSTSPPTLPEARLDVHIAVLNGTSRPRLASEAARLLRTEGWTVWLIGDADRRDYTESQVMADSGDASVSTSIMKSLNLVRPLEPLAVEANLPLSREDIDYVVVLGDDFVRAMRVPIHPLGTTRNVP